MEQAIVKANTANKDKRVALIPIKRQRVESYRMLDSLIATLTHAKGRSNLTAIFGNEWQGNIRTILESFSFWRHEEDEMN